MPRAFVLRGSIIKTEYRSCLLRPCYVWTMKLTLCFYLKPIWRKDCFRINCYTFYDTKPHEGKVPGSTGILIKFRVKHRAFGVHKKTHSSIFNPCRRMWWACHSDTGLLFTKVHHDHWTIWLLLGNKFIVAGDNNAKHKHWGSRLMTSRGMDRPYGKSILANRSQ